MEVSPAIVSIYIVGDVLNTPIIHKAALCYIFLRILRG